MYITHCCEHWCVVVLHACHDALHGTVIWCMVQCSHGAVTQSWHGTPMAQLPIMVQWFMAQHPWPWHSASWCNALCLWHGDPVGWNLQIHTHENYCLGCSRMWFWAFFTAHPPPAGKHCTMLEGCGLALSSSTYTVSFLPLSTTKVTNLCRPTPQSHRLCISSPEQYMGTVCAPVISVCLKEKFVLTLVPHAAGLGCQGHHCTICVFLVVWFFLEGPMMVFVGQLTCHSLATHFTIL